MDKSFFVTLSSANNGVHHNTNSHFKVELDQPLNIQSDYEVALMDITLNTGNYEVKEDGMIFVTSNVCEEQHFNNTRIPLLRYFYAARSRLYQYEFHVPHYKPVKHGIIIINPAIILSSWFLTTSSTLSTNNDRKKYLLSPRYEISEICRIFIYFLGITGFLMDTLYEGNILL